MLRHFLNPPNWFTSASIFCSLYAMSLFAGQPATPATLSTGAILVIFGGVFDLLDGRVARMTNRFTEFGVQLDSIADMISFGVAPAMLVYVWKLHSLGFPGVLITFWFALCAAFRLARFNVNAANAGWKLKGHSQGLTSTMAGGSLVTFVWTANGALASSFQPPTWTVAALVLALGLLMVSSLPFRSFRDIRENRNARRLLGLSLMACLAGAVIVHPSMWFTIGALLYLTLGVIDGLVVAWHAQREGQALDTDDDTEPEYTPGEANAEA